MPYLYLLCKSFLCLTTFAKDIIKYFLRYVFFDNDHFGNISCSPCIFVCELPPLMLFDGSL